MSYYVDQILLGSDIEWLGFRLRGWETRVVVGAKQVLAVRDLREVVEAMNRPSPWALGA